MQPKTIADYGGPFKDALPVEDTETQLSSDQFNALAEDTAQLTRTGLRAIVRFATTTSGDPAVIQAVCVWSNGKAQPTITRSGSGDYTITYPPSFVDANDVSEDVSFVFGTASIEGDAPGHARVRGITANVITVRVLDPAWSLSDLGGSVPIVVWLR